MMIYNVFVYDEEGNYYACAGQFTDYQAAKRCRDNAIRNRTFDFMDVIIESHTEYDEVLYG